MNLQPHEMRLFSCLFKISKFSSLPFVIKNYGLLNLLTFVSGKNPYLGLSNGGFIPLMLCSLIMGEKSGWIIYKENFLFFNIVSFTLIHPFTVTCYVLICNPYMKFVCFQNTRKFHFLFRD